MDPFVISSVEKSNEFDDEPSFGHIIAKNLAAAGDKILLVSGISSEELSAKQLLARSMAVARSLKAAGIKPGDVISIVSENRFEFAYVLMGTIMVNCTLAPINLTYTEREMNHAFNLSKPKIIFTSPFAGEKVVRVAQTLSYVRKVVLMDDANPYGKSAVLYNDFIGSSVGQNAQLLSATDKSRSVGVILCSSGTTGEISNFSILSLTFSIFSLQACPKVFSSRRAISSSSRASARTRLSSSPR